MVLCGCSITCDPAAPVGAATNSASPPPGDDANTPVPAPSAVPNTPVPMSVTPSTPMPFAARPRTPSPGLAVLFPTNAGASTADELSCVVPTPDLVASIVTSFGSSAPAGVAASAVAPTAPAVAAPAMPRRLRRVTGRSRSRSRPGVRPPRASSSSILASSAATRACSPSTCSVPIPAPPHLDDPRQLGRATPTSTTGGGSKVGAQSTGSSRTRR